MKYLLLCAFLVACGSDPVHPPPVPPPPPLVQYLLTALEYEDSYPGSYYATLQSYAGSPRIGFGEGSGTLVNPVAMSGVLHIVYADSSSENKPIGVLPAGNFGFTFVRDSLGKVKFVSAPPLWPFASGAVLSDSVYSYDDRQCFNPECTDYIRLAFRWVRQ